MCIAELILSCMYIYNYNYCSWNVANYCTIVVLLNYVSMHYGYIVWNNTIIMLQLSKSTSDLTFHL